MKLYLYVVSAAVSAILAFPLVAPASVNAAIPRQTAATTVSEATTSLGTVLVDSKGMTLYVLSSEVGGTLKCSGGCLNVWPPLTVPTGTTPTGPSDLTGKFATVTRQDGTVQVTYQGFPLYHFVRDAAPGDTRGNGISAFEGEWFAARPNAVPLAATAVVSGVVGISGAGTRVLGTVRAWYRLRGARQASACSQSSCALVAPPGSPIHLSQTPVQGARFTGWTVTRNGEAVMKAHARSITVRMVAGLRVKASYTT